MLSTTVSAFFPANTSPNAVKHIGQEKTEQCGPHEGKCLDTELGDLAIVTESATGLDEDSTILSISHEIHYMCFIVKSTHVIKVVTRVWKNKARWTKNPESHPPILTHMEANPLNQETTPKNKAMIMKANMNRVIKK